MKKTKKAELREDYLVTKGNKLIGSRYELSLQEQRLILVLVSLVDSREDGEFYEYEMRVSEFAELLGVENTNHTYLRQITKQLMEKVVEIRDDNKIMQVHWLSTCTYYTNEGRVKMELHRELAPYLLQLKEKFTSYSLRNILRMKSKYSIRLYELLKSNQFKSNCEMEIDELRYLLSYNQYARFANFNQRVLKPAVKEINEQTDLAVSYKLIKSGRSYESIRFDVVEKRAVSAKLGDGGSGVRQ